LNLLKKPPTTHRLAFPSSPVNHKPRKITPTVTGRAVTQYAHCPSSMSLTSELFMPKMLAIDDKGKKTTVTMVKA
jgi:hypothetical protein